MCRVAQIMANAKARDCIPGRAGVDGERLAGLGEDVDRTPSGRAFCNFSKALARAVVGKELQQRRCEETEGQELTFEPTYLMLAA